MRYENELLNNKTAVTILMLLSIWVGTFVVFCLLGMFVDPALGKDVRTGVVIAWGTTNAMVTLITLMTRYS